MKRPGISYIESVHTLIGAMFVIATRMQMEFVKQFTNMHGYIPQIKIDVGYCGSLEQIIENLTLRRVLLVNDIFIPTISYQLDSLNLIPELYDEQYTFARKDYITDVPSDFNEQFYRLSYRIPEGLGNTWLDNEVFEKHWASIFNLQWTKQEKFKLLSLLLWHYSKECKFSLDSSAITY